MRTIPVYDITGEELTSHEFRWGDQFIGSHNIDEYCRQIREFLNIENFQHLEISRNSNYDFGKRLRTAFLKINKGSNIFYAESLYQGSKVFYGSGHQHRLYDKTGDESLIAKSKWKGKKIIGIDFFGHQFETSALTDLHDFLYWMGLENTHQDIEKSLSIMAKRKMFYFTDCFDSPLKNSQSQSFAKYFIKWKNGQSVWDNLSDNQKRFEDIIENNKFEKSNYLCRKNIRQKVIF